MTGHVKLFVYGSLKKGLRNHDIVADCPCLGTVRTKERLMLLGRKRRCFPYLLKTPDPRGEHIAGELYLVPIERFVALDALEGHPRYFMRDTVTLEGGEEAVCYFYNETDDEMDEMSPTPLESWDKENEVSFGRGRKESDLKEDDR